MNSNEENSYKFETLNELVSLLCEVDRAKYPEILHSMQMPGNAFDDCCSWSDDSYTRNCIFECENFELILLCWKPGQITPIHDHDGKECWVKVIEGEFKETIYKENSSGELDLIRSSISKRNAVSYMTCKMGCHSLENLSNNKSLTLHLYAKPIRKCNVFDEDSGEFVNKNMSYDTVSNLEPQYN